MTILWMTILWITILWLTIFLTMTADRMLVGDDSRRRSNAGVVFPLALTIHSYEDIDEYMTSIIPSAFYQVDSTKYILPSV